MESKLLQRNADHLYDYNRQVNRELALTLFFRGYPFA